MLIYMYFLQHPIFAVVFLTTYDIFSLNNIFNYWHSIMKYYAYSCKYYSSAVL